MAGYIGSKTVKLSTTAANITGNITVGGTVDGRDISVDGTKLDGIETNATANQTDAEIKTAVQNSSDIALAGNPTTTTQSPSNNSTRVATTAYTDAAITALVNSAPVTLDTLNELAAALDDDPNYAATTATLIGTKLPLAGGAVTGNVTFGDSNKAIFGAGSDLQIYHDGSNSYVDDAGTGRLFVRGNDRVQIQKYTGEDMISCLADGAVKLYHDNAKKFETSASGVTVLGNIANGSGDMALDVAGDIILNAGGNVGIGVAAPAQLLHVQAAGTSGNGAIRIGGGAGLEMSHDNSSNTTQRIDSLYRTTSNDTNLQLRTGTLTFHTGTSSTERMRITSAGNVDFKTGGMNLKLPYDATTNYSANLGWRHLQLGNNGANRIIAGNTATGGDFEFIVNNTVDLSSNNPASHNGTVAMTIDSTGNVGINTSTPTDSSWGSGNKEFAIDGTTGYSVIHLRGTGAGSTDTRFSHGVGDTKYYMAYDDVADQHRMVVNASGNVGIGTSNPSNKFTVSEGTDQHGVEIVPGTTSYIQAYDRATSDYGDLRIDAQTLAFSTNNGSVRMSIDSSGSLFIGKTAESATTAGWQFKPSGEAIVGRVANDTIFVWQNSTTGSTVGSISITGSSTSYNESSDYRLKENVDYNWDATTRLKQLKPARFNFISDDTNTLVDGFLAHEVSSIVPEAVTGTHNETQTLANVVLSSSNTVLAENIEQSDWTAGKSATTDEDGNEVAAIYPSDSTWAAEHVVPKMQQFDKSKIVPLLVKTILELEARITALEA